MITFNRVLKQQYPYRAKYYQAVVKMGDDLRVLRRKFRTNTRAYEYGNEMVARYGRLVNASVMEQIQAGGKTGENADGGVSSS